MAHAEKYRAKREVIQGQLVLLSLLFLYLNKKWVNSPPLKKHKKEVIGL